MSTEPENTELLPQQSSAAVRQQEELWIRQEAEKIVHAIAWMRGKNRPATTYRMRHFGMRSSRRKDNELFWGHRTVTNLVSGVWATAWQEIQQHNIRSVPFREIIAACHNLPSDQSYRPKQGFMAFLLRELRRQKTKPWIRGNPGRVLFSVVYNYFNRRAGFTEKDFRVTSTLREGAFNHASRQILLWTFNVAQYDWDLRQRDARKHIGDTTAPSDEQPTSAPLIERRPRSVDSLVRQYRTEAEPHLAIYFLLSDTFQQYVRLCKIHEHAGSQPFPYEHKRFHGQSLKDVQRREVRRILERLPGSKDIAKVRSALAVLLNQRVHERSDIHRAKNVRHPYSTSRSHRRSIRTGNIDRHSRPVRGVKKKLSEMQPYAWEQLDRELADMEMLSERIEAIRDTVITFLNGKPPSFPSIQPVPLHDRAARLQTYQMTTEWFSHAFPASASPPEWGTYDAGQLEHFEGQAKARWLEAAGAVDSLKLHPLKFMRGMRPRFGKPQMSSFTIVYYEETPTREERWKRYASGKNYRTSKKTKRRRRRPLSRSYQRKKIDRDLTRGTRLRFVLALVVHGKSAFTDYGDGIEPRVRPEQRNRADVAPTQQRDYFFVDAPYTRLVRNKRQHMLFFPLACAYDDEDDDLPHGEEQLTQIVATQRRAQEQTYRCQCTRLPTRNTSYQSKRRRHQPVRTKNYAVCQINPHPEHIHRAVALQLRSREECIPEGKLSSAEVTCTWETEHVWHFHVHLPIEMPVLDVPEDIRNVIAFSFDKETFWYAVMTPDSTIIALGSVFVAQRVRRKPDDIYFSENYVHELTKDMVRLAKRYRAYIGVEDTSYLSNQPGASRTENREKLTIPFSTMMTALYDKALLAGLPTPYLVRNVSWRNTCGQCGRKLPQGTVIFTQQESPRCPSCHTISPNEHLAIPVLLNPVALVCNVPNKGKQRLRLSSQTIAGIFLRAITNWQDPRIAAENPQLQLPDMPINVVTSTDDPAVVVVMHAYLENALSRLRGTDERWYHWFRHDRGKLRMPSPFQQHSVRELVTKTPGSIGCIAWSPRTTAQTQFVAIKNQAGQYVLPSRKKIEQTSTCLLEGVQQNKQPVILSDSEATEAYPLLGVTWIHLASTWPNQGQEATASRFVSWLLREGSNLAIKHHYVPPPERLRKVARARLQQAASDDTVLPSQTGNQNEKICHVKPITTLQVFPLTGAGSASALPIYAQWIAQYRTIEPQVNMAFQTAPHSHEHRNATDCVHGASDESDDSARQSLFTDCRRCGTTLLSPYNRAISTARILQEQLVRRYENASSDDNGYAQNTPEPLIDCAKDDA